MRWKARSPRATGKAELSRSLILSAGVEEMINKRVARKLTIAALANAALFSSRPMLGQTEISSSAVQITPVRLSVADSIAVRRRAVRAQLRFEQIRRLLLPPFFTPAGRECDVRVGRLCQWNDNTPLPIEPKPLQGARAKLIASLDSASLRSPGDRWITAQRVRYLIEAGRDSAAVDAARSCAEGSWWCPGLLGLALHEAGEGTGADSAFAIALAAMPESERCRWTDISRLLEPALAKRFGKIGCTRKTEIAERIWWLADPFLGRPGNDRRAEHYARHMMSRIIQGTRYGYDMSWGDDLYQLIVRYGWSRVWSKQPTASLDPQIRVTGHEATPSFHFFPNIAAIDSVSPAWEKLWNLDEQPAAELYSPKYASNFRNLDPQLALFRRNDSLLVVAAYDVTTDTALAGAGLHSALILARDETRLLTSQEDTTPVGRYSLTTDGKPVLMSLEVWRPLGKRGARLRKVVSLAPLPPQSVAISDILLFEPATDAQADLAAIVPRALGALSARRDAKLGLYWETYGLAKGDSALPVALTMTRITERALRRIVESIGLAKRATPMSIAWRDTPSSTGIATRSVVLDLSLLPKGKYEVKIELKPASSSPVVATRSIQIR